MDTSLPTKLIPAQQWARRSGNGRGSVACLEQGRESGITRSQLSIRASRVRLRCFPKDEIQRILNRSQYHTVINVILRSLWSGLRCTGHIQKDRRAFGKKVNGIESRPNHDITQHSGNARSPKLVTKGQSSPVWRRSSNITQGWSVMDSAVGCGADRARRYKCPAMVAKLSGPSGKVEQSLCHSIHERRIASAFR